MRLVRIWFSSGMLTVGLLLGFGLRTSEAVPEFEAEFKAMYYKPDYNAKAKVFAAAVDAVSVEMPGPMGRRMAACNVCHIAGRPKRERNDYGQALDALLDRRADARNKQKIQEALKTVAKTKKNGTNVTFFELIGQGKLPGGDAH
jgi:hypothetical protein